MPKRRRPFPAKIRDNGWVEARVAGRLNPKPLGAQQFATDYSILAECQSVIRRIRSPCLILLARLSMEGKMKYRVHQLEVKKDTAQERLESFLNRLEGEILAIVPYVSPTFQLMGATSKVDFLLIVEKSD